MSATLLCGVPISLNFILTDVQRHQLSETNIPTIVHPKTWTELSLSSDDTDDIDNDIIVDAYSLSDDESFVSIEKDPPEPEKIAFEHYHHATLFKQFFEKNYEPLQIVLVKKPYHFLCFLVSYQSTHPIMKELQEQRASQYNRIHNITGEFPQLILEII